MSGVIWNALIFLAGIMAMDIWDEKKHFRTVNTAMHFALSITVSITLMQ